MTVERMRELLGEEASGRTDAEIQAAIDRGRVLVRVAIRSAIAGARRDDSIPASMFDYRRPKVIGAPRRGRRKRSSEASS